MVDSFSLNFYLWKFVRPGIAEGSSKEYFFNFFFIFGLCQAPGGHFLAATAVIKLLVCGLWGPPRWCEFNLVGYKLVSGMTYGFKFSVVTFSIFHLGLCFKTFHFSCTPCDRGGCWYYSFVLNPRLLPLELSAVDGESSYQTAHRGHTLDFVSSSLTPRTPGKPELCFPGLSKYPW